MQQQHRTFLSIVDRLRESIIEKVEYFDYAGREFVSNWDIHKKGFHYLDFGVEFSVQGDSIFSITWSSKLGIYGLDVSEASLSNRLVNYSRWNASQDVCWVKNIGVPLEEVEVYWAQSPSETDAPPLICPHSIGIAFSNASKVYIAAAQYIEHRDDFLLMSDAITVVFAEETARNYGIGPFNKYNITLPL